MTQYERTQKRYDLPSDATPDVIAEYVRSILSLPRARVERVTVEAPKMEGDTPSVIADIHFEKVEPPAGDIPEPDPTDLWQALSRIDMVQVSTRKSKIKTSSMKTITSMLMRASSEGRAPVGWATGDALFFLRWLGVRTQNRDKVPSLFLTLPLIESQAVGEDRLVLLCAKSSRMGPIRAQWGYATPLDVEEDDAEVRQ